MSGKDSLRKGEFLAIRDNLPEYLKGFTTFAYHIAWRLSEVARLEWNQINLAEGSIRLHHGQTKNKKGRIIYVGQELKDILTKQQKNKGGERCFRGSF